MAKRSTKNDEYEEEFEQDYEDEYEEEYEEEEANPGWLGKIVADAAWRRMAVVPLILSLFGLGTWMMWQRYEQEVIADATYQITPQRIEYTPPPKWIERDILEEVFKLGSLDTAGILDEGVTVQVAGAFELHPWVKAVERVRIGYPAKLDIALSYREPVAMVLLPPDPRLEQAQMLPIDANAVQLPYEDFNEDFANENFPRIDVGNTYPTGPVGSSWGDDVVTKAAKIAEILHSDWDNLKHHLHTVVRSSQSTSTTEKPDFDIRGAPLADGRPGLVVHWGRAPGDEQAIEPTAKAKLKKLQQWVNDIKITGSLPFHEIDLRTMRTMQESVQAARILSTRAIRQARAAAREELVR